MIDWKHTKAITAVFRCVEGLNSIIPKKRRRIVLYSNWGYRDNIRSLAEYLISSTKFNDFEIIVSVPEFKNYRTESSRINFVSPVHGLFYYLTSKYFFYAFGTFPIHPSTKQCVINLWHGMPIKRIGALDPENQKSTFDYFTYVIAYSLYWSDIIKDSFATTKQRVLISDAPRNDQLFSPSFGDFEQKAQTFERVGIWLPTYRSSSKLGSKNGEIKGILPTINTEEQLRTLNDLLKQQNILLLVKLHPLQDVPDNIENYSNVVFIAQNWFEQIHAEFYSFLSACDFLISDYSSVTVDYLLTEKPQLFAMDDESTYSKDRGFNMPLQEVISGPEYNQFEELLRYFADYQYIDDKYATVRHNNNMKFHANTSGEISKALMDTILRSDLDEF
jgi:CDP-glycerol glycerophosphotransferase (TagB/SpsB family)